MGGQGLKWHCDEFDVPKSPRTPTQEAAPTHRALGAHTGVIATGKTAK